MSGLSKAHTCRNRPILHHPDIKSSSYWRFGSTLTLTKQAVPHRGKRLLCKEGAHLHSPTHHHKSQALPTSTPNTSALLSSPPNFLSTRCTMFGLQTGKKYNAHSVSVSCRERCLIQDDCPVVRRHAKSKVVRRHCCCVCRVSNSRALPAPRY